MSARKGDPARACRRCGHRAEIHRGKPVTLHPVFVYGDHGCTRTTGVTVIVPVCDACTTESAMGASARRVPGKSCTRGASFARLALTRSLAGRAK